MLAALKLYSKKFPAIKKLHWYKYGDWESPVLRKELYFFGNVRPQFKKYSGLNAGLAYEIHAEPTVYAAKEDHEVFLRRFFLALKNEHGYFQKVTDKTERLCQSVERFIVKLKRVKNWHQLRGRGIRRWYRMFKKEYTSLFPYSFLWYQHEKLYRQLLAHALRVSGVFNARALVIPPPARRTYGAQAVERLWRIAEFLQKHPKLFRLGKMSTETSLKAALKNRTLKTLLLRYLRDFQWISTRHWLGKPLAAVDVLAQARRFLDEDIAQMRKERRAAAWRSEREFSAAAEKLRLSAYSRALIQTLRQHLFLKTYRKELLSKADFEARGLFEEIGKRMGLSYEQTIYLRVKELEDFLDRGILPDLSRLTKRQRGYVFVLIKGKLYLLEKSYEVRLGPQAAKKFSVLKGSIANPGVARGSVKLVLRDRDLAKIKKGDVLVADMTNPNYLPMLKLAAAFVTARGGALSHAAVLSRELDKPCLIGVKSATAILKDGMFVEVDAHQGQVKVLRV